ncbi:ribosome biogenesis protein SPATA5L1 [Culex pipiens pallens]|uniref:ribosome biogenesis protein SPATA5L1 n=1 Tax=Culex pipiens pallens TaxID=42434 RepID=UPI001952F733|nr:ribosome biogenesis protein SPATA5L1 [Culex pipiens pallens]
MPPEPIPINHPVTPDSGHLLRTPQICEISSSLLPGDASRIPVGSTVLCNYTSGRRFLAKWFPPGEDRFLRDAVCYVDESVELLRDIHETGRDDPGIDCLEVVDEPLCRFESVLLDVRLDCAKVDQELIRSRCDLVDLLKDLLVPYCFGENCTVALSDLENESYGIVGVTIRRAFGAGKFGQIQNETRVEIDRMLFHDSRGSKPLGGLEVPLEAVRVCLSEERNENVLLAGPPGSGKYSLVKKVAQEGNHPLFEIRGLDFIKSLPGETESELRKTFERLEQFTKLVDVPSKSILLVKDVDRLCPKVSNKRGEDVANISRISSQFTALLDKYHNQAGKMIVVGTTSSLENLDQRVRRPGRLGVEVFIRMASENDRRQIVEAVLQQSGATFKAEIIEEIIRRTPGYVGADLELLVHTLQRTRCRQPSLNIQQLLDESLKKIRPTALRNSIGLITGLKESLDTIGGMENLKKTLRVSILGPLQNPAAFRRFGMSPLKGILLYGPPGCAKTTIARCLAAESRMTFLSVSAAEIYSPYVGDAEKLITKLFNQARQSAPAVIFLDEIDSLVGNRGSQGVRGPNDVNIRVLSTLLIEMDGIGGSVQSSIATSEDSRNILVIAATNRPDMIDDALLRPGRLTKLIHVPAPDRVARLAILRKVSEKVPLDRDVDLEALADLTERYSGADLQNLCGQAALHAAALDEDAEKVRMEHFRHVLGESRPSLTSGQIEWYERFETRHRVL